MSIDHWRRKAEQGATPASATAHDEPGAPRASPTPDCRIPGVAPDLSALTPWVDDGKHGPAKDRSAKDVVAQVQENIAEVQSGVYAQMLVQNRGNTDDPKARWAFLNTLDRVDDPTTRHKMMAKFAEQTGQPLEEFITQADWHGDRDKGQALSLISKQRDEAATKIKAMSPEQQQALRTKAGHWAQQVLAVSRTDEADNDTAAAGIYRALGPRSPEEVEAIRAAIRQNTNGQHSIYEELDRSLSGNTEDEAVAGLSGNPVRSAWVGLRNVDNNPERTKEILRGLTPEQLHEFQAQAVVFGTGWITSQVPEGADREEIKQLLAGKQDAADGEHLANLLRDPLDGARLKQTFTRVEKDDQTKKFEAARSPANILREFESMPPDKLVDARLAYDKLAAARGGPSWDKMIEARFGEDERMKARLEALSHGDRAESKALGFREALEKNDQAELERVLASPDLSSDDPKKKAAAQKERQAMAAKIQAYDATDQYVQALRNGTPPNDIKVVQRDVSTQLSDHFAAHESKVEQSALVDTGFDLMNKGVLGVFDHGDHLVDRAETVRDNRFAAGEMWEHGELAVSTKVRRSEKANDQDQKLELLENLESDKDLQALRDDYKRKYDGDPVASNPETGFLRIAASSRKMGGDSRPLPKIIEDIAREQMTSKQLRLEHLRQYGPTAARSDERKLQTQEELYERQHSAPLETAEAMRAYSGGNVGTEDLVKSQLAAQRGMLGEGQGPFGWFGRERLPQYSQADYDQQNKNTADSLKVQSSEKVKLAERNAEVLNKFALVASFIIANPLLAIAFDAAVHAAKLKMKEAIAGEAYDESSDLREFGVNMGVDAIFIALHAQSLAAMAGAGGGMKPPPGVGSTAGISGHAASEVVDNAITKEAQQEAVDQAVKDVATSAGATEKQAAAASGETPAKAGDEVVDIEKRAATERGESPENVPDAADDAADVAGKASAKKTSPEGASADAKQAAPQLSESTHAKNLIKKKVAPEVVDKLIADYGERGLKAVDILVAGGVKAHVALDALELATKANVIEDVLRLVNSGNLHHPKMLRKRLEKIAAEFEEGIQGTSNELSFAAAKAEQGKRVSLGGVAHEANNLKSGRADVVEYDAVGNAVEATQTKKIVSDKPRSVATNVEKGLKQLRGEFKEVPPDAARKVVHVNIANPGNGLYVADRAALERALKVHIDGLRSGETVIIVNGTGTHQFTQATP